MALREVRELLLLSYQEKILDETDFLLLYDINRSRNPDFPYWKYNPFNLESLNDDQCMAWFRFYKHDIYILADLFGIPENVTCSNGSKFPKIEALCIFLRRFAYPCRYGDLIEKFGRSVPELSMISNHITNLLYNNLAHKLVISIKFGYHHKNLESMLTQFRKKEHPLTFAGGLLTVLSDQFAVLVIKGHCIMATGEFTLLNFKV